MAKINSDTGFPAIRIEGGLLSTSVLTALRQYQLPGQKPEEYGVEKGLKLSDELGRFWRIAQSRWQQFRDLSSREDQDLQVITVEQWLLPLFTKVFDFEIKRVRPVSLGERYFPVTHMAFDKVVPFVLTQPKYLLDKGSVVFGEEGRKRSPAGLAQEYLNAEDNCLWAIVSNGCTLRLLRDNPALTRPAYIEINLEQIFEEELYVDFTLTWLLLHATRFAPQEKRVDRCFLEQWREHGQHDGERVLGELRYGVTEALRLLGTGFVAHPQNGEFRRQIQNGEITTEIYFQELLRLIYRFLFLLTTEDRNVLLDPKSSVEQQKLYRDGYSLNNLRERSRFRRYWDSYDDAWQQLLITFDGFCSGEPRLAQPALGGLFAKDQCVHLEAVLLANKYLYDAIFRLCYFQNRGVLTRISYHDLGTEELGSIYESLLELIPQIAVDGQWHFGFLGDKPDEESASGHTRKITGSYYTPDSLVQELIQSALLPVVRDRLQANPGQPGDALLSIKVCDPACGSGHFLLAAARALAAELAKVEAGVDQPTDEHYWHALHEIMRYCIFGVDVNPLSVELCRMALWLETVEPGKPLGFLDAHIRVGNSLVGVLDPKLIEEGIPQNAYKVLSGDDSDTVRQLKLRNRNAPLGDVSSSFTPELAVCTGDLDEMPEDDITQVENKRRRWLDLMSSAPCKAEKLKADLYTAAFFAEKTPKNQDNVPTNVELKKFDAGESLPEDMKSYVKKLRETNKFFHWHLAFPEIFERGGFDVVLGNPPWDRIKLQEKEFFSSRSLEIANAPNAAARRTKINRLRSGSELEQALYNNFILAKHCSEATSNFVRESGRFIYTKTGDINLYAIFAEHLSKIVKEKGRAGIIVPTGIATDDSTKAFFAHLFDQNLLVSLYDLENREGLFADVHKSYKFCLMTMGNTQEAAELSFYSTQPNQIKDKRRCFSLTAEDIKLLNPNSKTCPVFRSQKDAELTKKLYRAVPVLIAEMGDNPWGISFQAMFHMANDSGLFRSYENLESEGATLNRNIFSGENEFLPLYEAKMIHQFDHRWATYETDGITSRDCTLEEKEDLAYSPLPRYWVDSWQVTIRTAKAPKALLDAVKKEDLEKLQEALESWAAAHAMATDDLETVRKLLKIPADLFIKNIPKTAQAVLTSCEDFPLDTAEYSKLLQCLLSGEDVWPLTQELLERRRPKYLLGWRDICRATDERTVIASVIPISAVGNTFPLIFSRVSDSKKITALLGNLNTLVYDYIARQKVGGTHLTYGYIKQFPTLPPDRYSEADLTFIIPRVLELTYTSHDLKPFAEDLGYTGSPFKFDPARRHQLRSELDAYYAKLYGLTRDELCYILDPADIMGEDYPTETFRGMKNKDMNQFGEYRTQRLVLEAWDKLALESAE